MNGKKTFILRYEPYLQKKIDELAKFRSYSESKNKGIILAIEIASKVLKNAQSIKANKDKYDVTEYIKKKYELNEALFY